MEKPQTTDSTGATSLDFAALDIAALAGRDLDAAVAEHVLHCGPDTWPRICEVEHHSLDDEVYCYTCGDSVSVQAQVPPAYSSDIAGAYVMEDALAMHELRDAYMDALLAIVDGEAQIFGSAIECDPYHHGGDGWEVAWKLVHATPDQRCRAALKAVQQQQKEQTV